jgi:prepilin-type N-terminal cleavage/methylation domain-containing protein
VLRREEGFTLIELLVVLVIIGILASIAIGFQVQAREKAADATARMNIRIAHPAVEAYRADVGTYAGMTLVALQSTYSPGVQGIEIVSADDAGYCISANAGGHTWFKASAAPEITTTACS